MQVALYASRAQSQNRGGFLHGEAVHVDQYEGLSLPLCEAIEGLHDALAEHGVAARERLRVRRLAFHWVTPKRAQTAPAPVVLCTAHENAEKPCIERRVSPEAGQGFPGGHESILDDILGRICVSTHQTPGHSHGSGRGSIDKFTEGFFLHQART